MDPAEFLIGKSPPVRVLGDIDLAARKSGMAPAAFAAAAVRRSLYTGTLHRPEERLARIAGDGLLLAVDDDGELKLSILLIGREVGILSGLEIVA